MYKDKGPTRTSYEISAQLSTPIAIGSEAVGNTVNMAREIAVDQDYEQRQTMIREIITADFDGEEPDALFPFSGSIVQRQNGRWDTLNGSDLSEHGQVTIGRVRVIAAIEIAHIFPSTPVITNSYNRFDPKEPTMASIIKDEFIRRGIDSERIKLEEKSFSTITQFTEMIKMAVHKGWKKLTVVTNGYHLPRAIAQYENLDTIIEDEEFQATLHQFKESGGSVSIINADTILGIISNHFTAYLSEVKKTEGYKKTIDAEAQGLEDLRAGKYRVVLNPEKPRNSHPLT